MPHKKSKLLIEYVNFLRSQQCLSDETIMIRERFVKPFLHYLGNTAHPSKLYGLSAKLIHDYIIKTTQPLHRASKKHVTSSIRSFLRFAHIKSYLQKNLLEAVPVIATRKLDRLPQGISWNDAQKLLKMPDRNTHVGRRDFAVLTLLINYGVRIGQVTTLKLHDIHWTEGVICFSASKNSNALRLPLHKKVAHALLNYIKKDRKISEFQEVFLTVRGVQRPLGKNDHYYEPIKKYYIKAEINSTSRGSRVLRHTFATRLVNKKIPIKTISDLLGHRWIETTFIYTKVDVDRLRELAIKWPEVA